MSQQGNAAPGSRREALARERAAQRPRPAARPAPASPAPARATPSAGATPSPRPRRSLGSKLLGVGVFALVAAVVVGLSVPANAFYQPDAASATSLRAAASADDRGAQDLLVTGDGQIPTTTSDYTVMSWAQVLAQKYSRSGSSVGGTSGGAVRWPFPYAVRIMSPYGPRGAVAGCPTCAPFHSGVDLDGGNGAPIFSIADGVVTERSGGSWTYGNYAKIVSQVDGHEITAIYEHMQAGSSPLVVGQKLAVGDFVGLVGQTGEATAPHLHLEIDVDGARTDPIPWLKHYAG